LPQERPSLKDEEELLRVGIKADCIGRDSGQVARGAFLRREPHPETGVKRDTHGLSVNLRGKCSAAQTLTDWPKCHMIALLTVGSVRASAPNLDVVQTAADCAFHANIIGLPERGSHVPETDMTEAERLATLLAKASKPLYIRGTGFLEES